MGRWEPNARGRLAEAALELYVERGFDDTTVADIAERAGLTERSFFRHFGDKREVLFSGQEMFTGVFVAAIDDAPAAATAMELVEAALLAGGELLQPRRDFARWRHAVIAAHDGLQERELIKLASLATSIAEALRRRGVDEPLASLAAETGVAVFRVAFERWVSGGSRRPLPQLIRDSLEQLAAATVSLG